VSAAHPDPSSRPPLGLELGARALIGVTGATGAVGGRVAARLAKRGVVQRLIVRDPARAPRLIGAQVVWGGSYGERAAMTQALDGVHTLLLVSAAEDANRVALHTAAVDAAVAAGVERIVYLSFLAAAADATFTFARDHYATEQHIRATGLDFTFLRSSQYVDLVPRLVGREGVIAGPAGEGRVAWVARDDVADVAAAVLTTRGHPGRTYDVTGAESHTLAYAAEQLARVSGRPISYRDETLEEAYASRAAYGAPKFEVEGWVTSYQAVATGEMDIVADTVPRLTGHPAQTLPGFLDAHPGSWAHLRDAG
jgi:NAD(P)H dehydrogenase (quinone)